MFFRFFAAAMMALLFTWPGFAATFGPRVTCALNADKSQMIVTASNTNDISYKCLAECRINVANQRAFDRFTCTFSVGANASEKNVCARKGSGPGHFTKVSPTKSVCSPR